MRPSLEAAKRYLRGEIYCAEVGVNRGENAYDILTNLPRIKKMYLVDSYQEVHDTIKLVSAIRVAPFHDIVSWRYMTSYEASKTIVCGSLDFVYIDDDHTYEGAKTSIEAWLPKVREGGIIAGHDYSLHGHYAGVRQAVDELAERLKVPVNVAIEYDPPYTINGRCGRERNPHICDWWIYI